MFIMKKEEILFILLENYEIYKTPLSGNGDV